MNAIELKNLTRRFGSRAAVDGLTLSIREGEIFALLGQNGAGKTTTIRMLTGLLAPTSGDAEVFGHSILTDRDAAKRLTNLSPQETAVANRLSVRENLVLIARLYGMKKPDAEARAEELMGRFRLTDRAEERAKKLSGGMQRRLSLAMALVSDPKVLFLDEPTLGLDVRARRDLWREVESLRQSCTVILTTHYMEEAEALADRICILNEGRICALGTAEELREQTGANNLEEAFLALTEGGLA